MANIDFISFSYTPEIINAIVDRIGDKKTYFSKSVKVKDQSIRSIDRGIVTLNTPAGFFDIADTSFSLDRIISSSVRDTDFNYYQACTDFIKASTFDIPFNADYDLVKDSIFNFVGYSMLDRICQGCVEHFISRFNFTINSAGNEWTIKENNKGMFGYKYSANLQVAGINAGIVAWGASNGGCYVSLSGSAMAYIDITELYKMLVSMDGVQLTRVDLAQDFYDGEYTVKDAYDLWLADGFKASRGKPPKITWIKSGGEIVDSKVQYNGGCTLYVGDRKNGKCIRVYEKGLQLKDEEHPDWVRWEVQLGNKGRVIPFDVLLKPTEYFIGSYPCLGHLVTADEVCLVETKKRVYTKVVKKMINNLTTATSKRLCFLRDGLGMSEAEILNILIGDTTVDDLDDKFHVAAVSYELGCSQSDAEEIISECKSLGVTYEFTGTLYKDMMMRKDYLNKVAENVISGVDYPDHWD